MIVTTMADNGDKTDIKFPFELVDASPVVVDDDYFWESIAAIQLSTKRGWWGNAYQPRNMRVGAEYVEVGPNAIIIDREFLARKEALAVRACDVLVQMGIAKSITATCVNPVADRIECEVYPELEGVEPTTVVAGEFALEFESAPSAIEIWQDTIDEGEEIQDTTDTGEEIQDQGR